MSVKYGVLIKFCNDVDELHGIYNSFEEAKKAVNGFLKFTAEKYNLTDIHRVFIQNNSEQFELNFVQGYVSIETDKDFPVKFKVIKVVSGRFMDKNKSNKSKEMEFEKRYKNEYEKPVKGTYDSSMVDISRAFEQEEQKRMKNEYEKPVTGQYDSATKKHAEEEDKHLDEAFDQESQKTFEDYLRMNSARVKIEKIQKNVFLESDEPRPIVTFGLKGDVYYIGLTTPKGDTMWMKLNTVLNFNNNC